MQRWQAYMASAEADHRVAESLPREDYPFVTPPPMETPDVGDPWFPECEPFPRAT